MTTYNTSQMQQKLMVGYRQRGEGFGKKASVRPGGANPNDKTVVINPPRGVPGGGLLKTFHRKTPT